MTPTAPEQPRVEQPRERSRVLAALRALIRTRISAGIITILPFVITIWLVRIVFFWLRDASLWVMGLVLRTRYGRELLEPVNVNPDVLTSEGLRALPPLWQWIVSILAILLTVFFLYVIGLLAANIIGRRILDWVDYLVDRLPFVKTIYRALKQILALFSGSQAQNYQRVALVPFPTELSRSVAFVTSVFRDVADGQELCAVFIPSTPNPTTGFVFIVRRCDVVEVNWTVEEAVRVIMSGGVLPPSYCTMVPGTPPPAGLATLPPVPLTCSAGR